MIMTNISNLTPEQKMELLEALKLERQIWADNRNKEIDTYKALVDKAVTECFPVLEVTSGELTKQKSYVREQFNSIIELKSELYDTKQEQSSHSFMSTDGQRRIKIGHNLVDDYDDTVNAGITKVKEFINSLAKDTDTRLLVDTLMQLLSKDKKGTLKASRVLQLQQMAEKSGNQMFLEGVKIIRDAYRPQESKNYIRAEYRDRNGAWIAIPLGMTEA